MTTYNIGTGTLYMATPKLATRERIRRLLKSILHPRPASSRKVWTTRRGAQIKIAKLDDKHLGNILRLLERKAFLNYSLMLAATPPQGEYAALAYQEELAKLGPFCSDASPRHPLYPALIYEAAWRGLDWMEANKPGWSPYFDESDLRPG